MPQLPATQLVVLIGAWIWYELGSAGLAQSSQCQTGITFSVIFFLKEHTGITFCIAHSVSIGKQFKYFFNAKQFKST